MRTYTLEDLEFFPHPVAPGAVQARLTFPNGWGVSVDGGPLGCGLYGDGKYSFEVACINPRGEIEGDVFTRRTIAQVEDLLQSFSKRV